MRMSMSVCVSERARHRYLNACARVRACCSCGCCMYLVPHEPSCVEHVMYGHQCMDMCDKSWHATSHGPCALTMWYLCICVRAEATLCHKHGFLYEPVWFLSSHAVPTLSVALLIEISNPKALLHLKPQVFPQWQPRCCWLHAWRRSAPTFALPLQQTAT